MPCRLGDSELQNLPPNGLTRALTSKSFPVMWRIAIGSSSFLSAYTAHLVSFLSVLASPAEKDGRVACLGVNFLRCLVVAVTDTAYAVQHDVDDSASILNLRKKKDKREFYRVTLFQASL